MDKLKGILRALLQPLLAIVVGLGAGAIAIAIVGGSVTETYAEMWKGAFGSFYFFTNTLSRATPIMLIGLGVALAFRAGFFNMGSEGQMVLGALSAAVTAIYLPGPAWFKLVAALLAGVIAGGLWSAFAGWLDARFRMNLLITTLLLNYIASLFAGYVVSYPLMDRSGSAAMAQTVMVDKSVWLPKLFQGMSLHAGFLFALIGAIALAWFMRYMVKGYEIRMMGGNPLFASYGGVNRGRLMLYSMFVSGGFAGLAGAGEVLGTQYRYLDGALTSPGYAWSGIMATLLAGSNPLGTALAAILLAALQTGGMGVERNTDVPLEVSSIIQAVLILFISAKFTYSFFKKKKKAGA
ncbi:simple sugar transport system permease protein [Paenibacillus algorifonticola]|uniref:Simple sugar transport system permease protein n=1 Tax=Paenibacillus algorifonticola TaxID=684063 RepID=A0A1I2IP08_9BACL|nr:ABC transporter permease [Paenibacillus algorifonticola]SFF42566.1 simple sugar transport system permease protein [Paenibacillus algorifonticola]